MKITLLFAIILLLCHVTFAALAAPNSQNPTREANQTFDQGKFDEAIPLFKKILDGDANNSQARLRLAQSLSYTQHFSEAIEQYNRLLENTPDHLDALEYKADVLSWNGQFEESVRTYDQRLALEFTPRIARQKARVLGWWKHYGKSLEAYTEAFDKTQDPHLALEEKGKQGFWNGWPYQTLKNNRQLVTEEPENVEVLFDLAQTEAYLRQWKSSAEHFEQILKIYSSHFRASDSLEKLAVQDNVSFTAQAGYFWAHSNDRQTDINMASGGLTLEWPTSEDATLFAGYSLDHFDFETGDAVLRQQAKIGASFWALPAFQASVAYLPTLYTDFDRLSHRLDASATVSPLDPIKITLKGQHDDITNNRNVIAAGLDAWTATAQIQANAHRRLVLTGDINYSWLSDDNERLGFDAEALAFITYDPKRLSLDLKMEWYDYTAVAADYFSPNGFWANTTTLHWRHTLNKNGLYYGAKDTYYGLKYKIQIDRDSNFSHGGALEFHLDFSHTTSVHFETSGLTGRYYDDCGGFVSLTQKF